MSQHEEILIRAAKTGDAPEIANVHLNSWREAYKGLLPQKFLDQLPLTFKRRMNWWEKIISNPDEFVLLVAEDKVGVIGFACFQAGRDQGMEKLTEVAAIYILEKYKGQGIGFSLLSSGFKQMKDRGFKEAYCWVLEGNPTIKFYERSGATVTDQIKQDEISGQKVNELVYRWGNLEIGDDNL